MTQREAQTRFQEFQMVPARTGRQNPDRDVKHATNIWTLRLGSYICLPRPVSSRIRLTSVAENGVPSARKMS